MLHACDNAQSQAEFTCSFAFYQFTILQLINYKTPTKQNIDTIYLELPKAFDKLPRNRLIQNLQAQSVDGLVCNWISSLLTSSSSRMRVIYHNWSANGLLTDGNEYVWMVLAPVGNEYGAGFSSRSSFVFNIHLQLGRQYIQQCTEICQ